MKTTHRFVWDETHSVNVQILDNQHSLFIATLENLYQALMNKRAQTELQNILTTLSEYATIHFATEEKYFSKFNYEHTNEHVLEHQRFIADLQKFQSRLNKGEITISLELLLYLENWLVKHVNTMDKLYIKCFTSHGLK